MNNTHKLILVGIATLIVAVLIGRFVYPWNETGGSAPTNFEECAAQGNPIMESYPRQCRSKEGKLFVEDVKVVPPTQPPTPDPKTGTCIIGGCSSQLCVDDTGEPIVSTCEFRAEYACYNGATCERQTSGDCGWTQTAELTACLRNPPPLE
ncbi:MAG: hypothetical protein WC787_01265 [Patescibacteria group bacterium]|jgi:hypothetical protein